MSRNLIVLLGIAVGVLLLVSASALAQTEEVCPALVEKALSAIADNCVGLDRNSACYGFNRVDATFAQQVPEGFFSDLSDRAELAALQTIQTVPLNTEEDRWGIAVLNVQANVPNSLPGQAVVFMLLGDVGLENAVPPEAAFQGVEPITVTTTVAANLRSAPTTHANVVVSLPAETALAADALNPTGEWLRVASENGPGWISRSLVTSEVATDDLPVISSETRSPMQAFYFNTGVGKSACNQAPPSLLVVQGPKHVGVDITANGAHISLASTIVLRTLEGGMMQAIVIDGGAYMDGVALPPGFTAFIQLSEDGHSTTGFWTGVRPLTAEELEELQGLELIPLELLHYLIELPTPEEIAQLYAALLATQQTSGEGTTFTAGPATTGSCRRLRPTSPLGNVAYDTVPFFWDPEPGATSYVVTASDTSGAVVFEGQSSETNMAVNTRAWLGGPLYRWQVRALAGERVICTSGFASVERAPAPPLEAPPASPFTASWSCAPLSEKVTVSWANALPTDTITISFMDEIYGPLGGAFSGSSGSTTFTPVSLVGSGVVSTSSGQVVYLSPSSMDCSSGF